MGVIDITVIMTIEVNIKRHIVETDKHVSNFGDFKLTEQSLRCIAKFYDKDN